MGYDSNRSPKVHAMPERDFKVSVEEKIVKGRGKEFSVTHERVEHRINAKSEGEAIRRVLRRAKYQQRRVIVRQVEVEEMP